jgi:hypothetical protein
MPRLRRAGASISICLVAAATLLWAPSALADHCPPIDNPDPIPGNNTTYCHTPRPADTPDPTPKATAKPTTAPTAAPRTAAPGPVGPARTSSGASTPAPTPFDIEVPDEPTATTEIVIEPDTIQGLDVDEGEQAGTASTWIFGFLVGLVIGALIGRASWGVRRRRRQQIFG